MPTVGAVSIPQNHIGQKTCGMETAPTLSLLTIDQKGFYQRSKIGEVTEVSSSVVAMGTEEEGQHGVFSMLAVATIFDIAVVTADNDEGFCQIGRGQQAGEKAVKALEIGDGRR